LRQIRKRLTYSNVMSSLAVFLVLGGASAYAAKKIGSHDLKANSVTTAKIKKNAVTTKKIKKNAIVSAKIKNGAVTTAKLGDGSVTTPRIADGAVTAPKIPNGGLTTAKLSDVTVKGLVKVGAASGVTAEAARAAATPVQLLASGPLSVYAKCFTDTTASTTYAEVFAATTEAGSVLVGNSDSLYGNPFLDPGTAEDARQIYTNSTGANSASGWRTIFQMSAPSGASLAGEVALYAKNGTLPEGDGVYGPGDTCLFSGFATS